MLTNYLSLEKFSHEDRFSFEIVCNNEEMEFISIPSMILQPFVENALLHGALKAEKHGFVKIEFHVLEKNVTCRITDNGPGLGGNTSEHKSSAIEITKERLTMLSGNENSVEIINRYFENKRSGVEVTVTLPIRIENETV
jgi:LytS/YehU family sensor histidine kinase